MSYTEQYLAEVSSIAGSIDVPAIDGILERLIDVRDRGGRCFCVGVGGSAANASHLVNDLRKIAGIEAYSPSDNVAELTARVNDEGWEHVFSRWLAQSRIAERDLLFVLSVGGGDLERGISVNLVRAMEQARTVSAAIVAIVGRAEGHAARFADVAVVVPTVNPLTVTAHAEAFQSVVCHLLVSHPRLRRNEMRWESVTPGA